MRRCIAIFSVLVLACCIRQSAAEIVVSGIVADADKTPVAGAHISFIYEPDSLQTFAARTAADGAYEILLDPNPITAVGEIQEAAIPGAVQLLQNYPNPFNPHTVIQYKLAEAGYVELAVYNVLGHEIRTLVDRYQEAGIHSVEWDGRNASGAGIAAGVYLYRLRTAKYARAAKMTLSDGARIGSMPPGGNRSHKSLAPVRKAPERYTVRITGTDIENFQVTGVQIPEGSKLDFGVSRLPTADVSSKPNILLVIADDMGLDATPGYEMGSVKPNMPYLQAMIDSGIRFNNVWANPTCTPTRASILTGKYGFRTNVLKVGDILDSSEVSIQQLLTNRATGYSHALIGKWHLSRKTYPTVFGIAYYAGLLTGSVRSYWEWDFWESGERTTSTTYTTTKFTDLAIDWVASQTSPWFLWLAYNAPHSPFHLAPEALHYQGELPADTASIAANPTPYYMSMLEAMDTEIGRLLNSFPQEVRDNTLIIFIGDNGSPKLVAQEYNIRRVKGTVYNGGINVPMIVSGKNVRRANAGEDALLNSTDLFATIADISGAGITEINDSKSFKELLEHENIVVRNYIYSEAGYASENPEYTIRNTTHKYIRFKDGSEALFNLSIDELERSNLLKDENLPLSSSDRAIRDELVEKVTEIRE